MPPGGRGRGHYSNKVWTKESGTKGGLPPTERQTLPPAPTPASRNGVKKESSSGVDEDDDPFKPPEKYRVDDSKDKAESTAGSKESAKATAEDSNKIKFNLTKPSAPSRVQPNTDLLQSSRAGARPTETASARPSVFEDTKPVQHTSGSRAPDRADAVRPTPRDKPTPAKLPDPTPKKKYKTVLIRKPIPRPDLADKEHRKSQAVFYRAGENESVIGTGTYGKVYKSTNVYTAEVVALKRIRTEGERDGVSFPKVICRISLISHSFPSPPFVRSRSCSP